MGSPDFSNDLAYSRGRREATDLETLRARIPGCVCVEKTGEDLDRLHVDYVAYLRRGAVLHIDGKTRRAGAAQFWTKSGPGRRDVPIGEPDLAIEIWSVKPTRAGWTFDESSDTDLILYTFDQTDTDEYFLLSFPLLRMAARRSLRAWMQRFKKAEQETRDDRGMVAWKSECCFVPGVVVQDAIRCVERGFRQQKAAAPVLPMLTADDIRF